jgi:hypothetical protein
LNRRAGEADYSSTLKSIFACIGLRVSLCFYYGALETPHRAVTAPVRLAVFLCPPVLAGCVAKYETPSGEIRHAVSVRF